MRWYRQVVFNNYLNFQGRARRKEFWFFTLVHVIICFALYFVGKIALISYLVLTVCPAVGVGIRRLHDTGRNGMWVLAANVPFLGFIYFYFMFLDSDPNTNIYGESPKDSYMDKILKDEVPAPSLKPLSESRFDKLDLTFQSLNPEELFSNEAAVQFIIVVLILLSILIKFQSNSSPRANVQSIQNSHHDDR